MKYHKQKNIINISSWKQRSMARLLLKMAGGVFENEETKIKRNQTKSRVLKNFNIDP